MKAFLDGGVFSGILSPFFLAENQWVNGVISHPIDRGPMSLETSVNLPNFQQFSKVNVKNCYMKPSPSVVSVAWHDGFFVVG